MKEGIKWEKYATVKEKWIYALVPTEEYEIKLAKIKN